MKINDQADSLAMPNVEASILPSQMATMRDELRTRYGLGSELLRPKDLARILGLNVRTIRNAIRQGRFAIEHERLFSTSVVKLDDLARWLCGTQRNATYLRRGAEAPALDDGNGIVELSKEDHKQQTLAIANAVAAKIERAKRARL